MNALPNIGDKIIFTQNKSKKVLVGKVLQVFPSTGEISVKSCDDNDRYTYYLSFYDLVYSCDIEPSMPTNQ